MWYGKLNRQQKIRRWAVALWTTPLIMLFPLWLGVIYDPRLLADYPALYLLFFGAPFAVAAALYIYAWRVGRS